MGDKATNGAVAMNKANILGLKDPENSKKVYNISDMEKTINSTFSNKVKINEDRYKKDPDYRDKINYYYFQAKYQLKDGKIIEDGVKDRKKYIKINKNGKIITLFEVSKEESLYHNVNYSKDGSFYIETDPNKINRKFVNEDGYEIVLSNNLSTIIKNPTVYGTFNYYTYKGIEYDTLNHTVDINLWQKYGSDPDDWTTEVQRKKANALAQKLSKVPFFSDQGFKNYLNSRKNTKVTPDTYKNYLEIIKGGYMMSSKIFKKWYEINIYLIILFSIWIYLLMNGVLFVPYKYYYYSTAVENTSVYDIEILNKKIFLSIFNDSRSAIPFRNRQAMTLETLIDRETEKIKLISIIIQGERGNKIYEKNFNEKILTLKKYILESNISNKENGQYKYDLIFKNKNLKARWNKFIKVKVTFESGGEIFTKEFQLDRKVNENTVVIIN